MTVSLLTNDFFSLPGGGRMRYGVFEPEGGVRATIFVLPGRREFIEKKHAELLPLLAQGCRLIVVEPRGQGLSSRFLEGEMRQRDHLTDFDQALREIGLFYEAVVVPRRLGPFILHGHSLGGHFALRWLAEGAPGVDACFLTAPMLAIFGTLAHVGAYGLSWAASKLFGHATHYAPLQADYGHADRIFHDNYLSQDEELFGLLDSYYTALPDLTVGGITWGWLTAALQSIHVIQGRGYLQRVQVPMLALLGGDDKVTPAGELARVLQGLPQATVTIIEQARHDILSEAQPYRGEAWDAINAFLKPIISAPR